MCNKSNHNNIENSSDINSYLLENIETQKNELKNVLKQSSFTDEQKQDLDAMFTQYYYSLLDLAKSITILNNK